jgi:hypothetical protein
MTVPVIGAAGIYMKDLIKYPPALRSCSPRQSAAWRLRLEERKAGIGRPTPESVIHRRRDNRLVREPSHLRPSRGSGANDRRA